MKQEDDNYLLYDGDCPFCSRYVRLARLRETVGAIRLINARDGGPEVEDASARGYDLNEGMLLHLDGRFYFGSDCLNRVALLSSGSGVFNRINRVIFRSPRVSAFAYPVLRAGRNLTLRLLGRSRLEA